MEKFVVFLASLFLMMKLISAIPCMFKFAENHERVFEKRNTSDVMVETPVAKSTMNPQPFFCEENPGYFVVQSRFNYDNYNPEEDEFEPVPACDSRKQTISPTHLNNIKNEWKMLALSNQPIEELEIENCVNQQQPCSDYSGSLVRPICVQRYLKITLKAFDGKMQKLYDDDFYYPSHCACEVPKAN